MRPYWSPFTLLFQDRLRYRANAVFYLSLVVVPPLAMFFLWRAVLGEAGQFGTYGRW